MSESIDFDPKLLALAESCLSVAGFEIIRSDRVVRAQNSYASVLIATYFTVADLLQSEPDMARQAARTSDTGSLDNYLVLLTAQEATVSEAKPLFDATYNLRHVRRIIRVGVATSALGVETALRPVLPLPEVAAWSVSGVAPLDALRQRLKSGGADPELIDEAFSRYRHPEETNSEPVANEAVEE